jgi:hypothetical protein
MFATAAAMTEPTRCNETTAPITDRRFFTAGDAIFTIASHRTGQHFTYKITTKTGNDGRPVSFVALLTGPDNTSSYTYLGLLDAATGVVRRTAKSRVGEDAPGFKAIAWAMHHLLNGRALAGADVIHAGRCCRCGRVLTTPESVAAGIGPECAQKASW